MLNSKSILLFLLFMTLVSCSSLTEEEKIYIQQINDWHHKRIESLKAKESWLSLAGLFWLKPGENSFGSDKSNDIVFPEGKAADFMGWFELNEDEVKIRITPGIIITCEDKPVSEMILQNDNTDKQSVLRYKSLSWFVIKRQDKYAIRLKDSEHPEFERFKGIDRFGVNPDWKIEAKFFPYDPLKKIEIPTIMGTILEQSSPGFLQFEINEKIFRLDSTGDIKSKRLFLIFADQTNGDKTYGAGRFLSVDFPHPDSTIYIDFNKAYNPPCAFTKYATCPLPPKQNQLPIEIKAGEKNYAHALH
jgi:uncharacterized protein (DUF1684 family)